MRSQDRPRRLTRRRRLTVAVLCLSLIGAGAAIGQVVETVPALTGPEPPMANVPAEPLAKWQIDDVRKMRAYPEQPPVIPHAIEGYQLTVNANRCLTCHRRQYTEASGAPMISITHFMTREGQMLADVSPRRYFCMTCHVRQAEVQPLIGNVFRDMSEMGADSRADE